MVDVRLEIYDGTNWLQLDLSGEDKISFNRQFNDITTFGTVGNFTREFRIPATEANIEFFGTIFNVNFTGNWFDFRKRTTARLWADTMLLSEGYIQVRKVYRQGMKAVDIEIAYFSETPAVAKEVGDKKLADLTQLSTLNTALEYDSLTDSITETLEGGNVIYALIDRGQLFSEEGLVGQRRVYDSDNPLYVADFTPCVNALWIWQQIMADAGYYYEGTEIDTELEKYWIPWLSGRFVKTDVTPESELFRLGIDTDLTGQSLPLTITTSFDENYDNGNNCSGGVFTAPHTGYYTFRGWLHLQRTSGSGTTFINIVLLRNDVQEAQMAGSAGVFLTSNNVIHSVYYEAEVLLEQNDTVKFRILNSAGSGVFTIESSATYDPAVGTGWELVSCSDPLQDATVDMVLNAPDMKQIDFLRSIVTMHNLVIVPDKLAVNKLLIQPMNDYLLSGADRDWTSKLDMSKDVVVYPTTEFQKRNLMWSYIADSDVNNKVYQDREKRVYGEQEFEDTGNEFADGDGKTEVAFASTPCSAITGTGIVIPKFISESGEFINPKPRILYRAGTSEDVQVYDFDANLVKDTEVIMLNHYQSVDAEIDTDDLNFGMEVPLYSVSGTPYPTLYNRYWRKYIREIYGGLGTGDLFDNPFIMEAYFDLKPHDVYTVEFSDEIFIIDSWWRVLDIMDYAVGDEVTTKVRLIKILDAEVECAWTPHTSGVGGLITFLSADGVTTGDGTKACCELYGYVWNNTSSKCYHQNGISLPQVVKPQEAPGDTDYQGMAIEPFTTVTATYTVGDFDKVIYADAVSGAITINLPLASKNLGRVITVKKIDATGSNVVISPTSPETVDGAGSRTINTQYVSVNVQAVGNKWFVI